jgi:hypothetical protein
MSLGMLTSWRWESISWSEHPSTQAPKYSRIELHHPGQTSREVRWAVEPAFAKATADKTTGPPKLHMHSRQRRRTVKQSAVSLASF